MKREYKSGTEFSLSFDGGKLTIDHLSLCWEKEVSGVNYTFASFAMNDKGRKAEQEYDYDLLSHGVVWIQNCDDGRFGLKRNDGMAEYYLTCEINERSAK